MLHRGYNTPFCGKRQAAHRRFFVAVFTPVALPAFRRWLQTRACAPLVGEARAISPIREGIENSNFLVAAAGGRFVFTIFELLDSEMASYYADLIAHLAADGAPAPRSLPLARRADAVAPTADDPLDPPGPSWRGKPAALVEFVEGEWLRDPDPAACAQMGETVAALHLAARGFSRRMRNPRGAPWRKQAAARVRESLPADERKIVDEELRNDSELRRIGDALPWGASHCDLFRNNVLWRDGQIAGVIDFYFGGDDWLIFDLAVCACDWAFVGDGESARFDEEKLRALFAGYRRRRALSPLEIDLLPRVFRVAAFRFWLSRLCDFHFPRPARELIAHDPRLFLRILRRAREDGEAISAAARDESAPPVAASPAPLRRLEAGG